MTAADVTPAMAAEPGRWRVPHGECPVEFGTGDEVFVDGRVRISMPLSIFEGDQAGFDEREARIRDQVLTEAGHLATEIIAAFRECRDRHEGSSR